MGPPYTIFATSYESILIAKIFFLSYLRITSLNYGLTPLSDMKLYCTWIFNKLTGKKENNDKDKNQIDLKFYTVSIYEMRPKQINLFYSI